MSAIEKRQQTVKFMLFHRHSPTHFLLTDYDITLFLFFFFAFHPILTLVLYAFCFAA